MEQNLFSKADYEKILQNRIKNPSAKFLSAKMLPLSENVEGFMGEHYKLKITYEINNMQMEDSLFVKTKPQKNQTQIDLSAEMACYNKEIFFYDFLLKEFDRLGFDTSFSAKGFFCLNDSTLVLEDLSMLGFRIAERCVPYTVDKTECVLKSLAKLHAASFAYERKKSEELGEEFRFGNAYEKLFEESLIIMKTGKKSNLIMNWWENSLQTLVRLIDFLPDDETRRSDIKNRLKNFEFGKIIVRETNLAKTFGHGDLWSNNMMFKFEDKKAVECKLVDFQCYRYFYPSFDVLLAIFSNTDRELRKKHLNQLYEYYYSTLSKIMLEYEYKIEDILPLEDLYKGIELVRPEVMLQVAAIQIIIYLPVDTLNKSVTEEGTTYEEILYGNEAIAVAEFQRNDKFREALSSAIYDLYEAIVLT